MSELLQYSPPPFDYGCSQWMISSQRAAYFYNSEVRLWGKRDLEEIERQLSESSMLDHFTVRRIDGTTIQIKNPMLWVENPIWEPYVDFRGYWQLVRDKPNGPPETYLCSYLVNWKNRTLRDFEEQKGDPTSFFENRKELFNVSRTWETLKSHIQDILGTRRVTKIICFGLGDITRRCPEGWMSQYYQDLLDEDIAIAETRVIQHSIALALAEMIYYEMGQPIRLLAQDPAYTKEAMETLRAQGFEIVGRFGAGGFAEIDDDSVVFSAFPGAPVKQIIADLARPALIIRAIGDEAINEIGNPYADAESPRTRQMWQQYKKHTITTYPEEAKLKFELDKLELYVRNSEDDAAAADYESSQGIL